MRFSHSYKNSRPLIIHNIYLIIDRNYDIVRYKKNMNQIRLYWKRIIAYTWRINLDGLDGLGEKRTYNPKMSIARGKLKTPTPTIAVTLWDVEYHHFAFREAVIGSQSSNGSMRECPFLLLCIKQK